jgi:hypothetical protein
MKYLLLIHHDEAAFSQMSDTTKRDLLAESVQVTHQLHAAAQYIDASPLYPSSTAARVQVRDGKRSVTDGPFVETHEQVAGYFLVHAASLDEAVSIAARIPGARLGYIDVRQVREIEGLPEK